MNALRFEQLPEGRRAVLAELKRSGPATMAHLADSTGMTREAVRQQLAQLQRLGWVAPREEGPRKRGRAGRPPAVFALTPLGDHLFPKDYDALSVAVLDAVAGTLGSRALEQVLAAVVEEKVRHWEPRLRGLGLKERVSALKEFYASQDPFTEVEASGMGFVLVERNCPFLNTAMARPALCSVTVSALRRLLGVRVVREKRFQDGHGRCAFRVLPGEAIDERFRFALEEGTFATEERRTARPPEDAVNGPVERRPSGWLGRGDWI